jgi:hypothetical protein
MDGTVFFTVISGVLTYVVGQLILKLVIDPVHEMRKTIGRISHALIEHAAVIANPGVPTREAMDEASTELRKLSSEIQSHLYLVPLYDWTRKVFRLPTRKKIIDASGHLIGLSNSVYSARERIYEINASRVTAICDALNIYQPEGQRSGAGEADAT